jgi:hypothetical protein
MAELNSLKKTEIPKPPNEQRINQLVPLFHPHFLIVPSPPRFPIFHPLI